MKSSKEGVRVGPWCHLSRYVTHVWMCSQKLSPIRCYLREYSIVKASASGAFYVTNSTICETRRTLELWRHEPTFCSFFLFTILTLCECKKVLSITPALFRGVCDEPSRMVWRHYYEIATQILLQLSLNCTQFSTSKIISASTSFLKTTNKQV